MKFSSMEEIDIKSPIFVAEPGWGGKLFNLVRRHLYSVTIPLLIIFTLIFCINPIYNNYFAPTIDTKFTTPSLSDETIGIIVQNGQGISHLVKVVFDDYLANSSPKLVNAGQYAFVINYVSSLYKNELIIPGQIIEFRISDIVTAIQKSKELTDYQMKQWSQYYRD